ncbi:hypothetical protein [Paenibacillus sediminis]|uniref:Uncharacterized protein n=1 Tax=Paenibacillus sediminis TaxID=664909 RepID=A0ABS4H4I3_9BACL|nr:hypothetical protein [Paenibacillus sediminis]MBP1937444.1 hypothetical protein [Paenibacillus sediminis]
MISGIAQFYGCRRYCNPPVYSIVFLYGVRQNHHLTEQNSFSWTGSILGVDPIAALLKFVR